MGIRTYKPTSAGRRNASVSDFSELTDKNKKPEKSLTEPLKKTGGRNSNGRITTNWPSLGIQYKSQAKFDPADYEVVSR